MRSILERVTLEKSNKICKLPMDSGAVFHKESEYVIGFRIRASNNKLSFIFWKNRKKAKKLFDLFVSENRVELGQIYYQNNQREKLYKSWKFQWIPVWSSDRPGEIPWIYPSIPVQHFFSTRCWKSAEQVPRCGAGGCWKPVLTPLIFSMVKY